MTGTSPTGYLRNSPRQARSAARVERLLDAAEEVFEEVGYDAATTNLVAARADVPVGTLYRWFPDKAALAEALTDRYIHELLGMYVELLRDLTPAEHMSNFIRQVMAVIVERARSQRALPALLVSTMVPGRRSDAGTRLRGTLTDHIGSILDVRVPGIPADVRDDTAEVCVAFLYLVISAAMDDGVGARLADEYVDAMIAYLEAKFPTPDDPVWSEAEPAVTPRFPAPDRTARLAAVTLDDGIGST
ncbi:MAG: TetR/AcrR family transcriptional regulator [Actinobacteria bacterium]|nr:TetR/AcrR family transcriptional regulator [Actinomycetota bacterium]